jgi:nitrous oxidase accessory protein
MERIIQITLLSFLPLLGFGRSWEVRPNGPIRSIRQAIVLASPGDSIFVQQGVYLEKDLQIDKPLFIKGTGQPILDGEHQYEIVSVKSDNVTFEGFRLRHSGYSGWNDIAAIRLYGVKNVCIRGNTLEDTFFGIFSQNADNCLIEGNILSSHADNEIQSGNGIHCWHCNRMQIIDNQITRHRDGIYFEFVTNSLIRGNRSFNNIRYGLHFMFSHNDRYENNLFRHNEAGVSVMFSHGVDMQANRFEENLGSGAYGILLKEITDSRIEGDKKYFFRQRLGPEGSGQLLG